MGDAATITTASASARATPASATSRKSQADVILRRKNVGDASEKDNEDEDEDEDEDGNEDDPACRILVVSASLEVGLSFVERFKVFSSSSFSSSSTLPLSAGSKSLSSELTPTSTPKSHLTIPHVLSNKYYSAPVHFALHAPVHGAVDASGGVVRKQKSTRSSRPPAVVFVWERSTATSSLASDKWRQDAEDLAKQVQDVEEWEPEVMLGVRVGAGDGYEGEEEDNADIDNALMQLGFEYVDVADSDRRVVGTANSRDEEDEDDGDIGIPGLPRVLDALSTIMWPSMTSAGKGKGKLTDRQQAEAEQEDIMHELLLSVSDMSGLGRKESEEEPTDVFFFSPYDFGKKSSTLEVPGGKRERKQPWLDTNNLSGDDGMLDSPGDIEGRGGLSPFGLEKERMLGKKVSMGFEDDFAEFISAPMEVEGQDKGKRRANVGLGVDLEHLDLSEAGFEEMRERTPVIETAIAESVVTGDSLGLRSASRYASSNFGDIPDEKIYEQLGEDEEWVDADNSAWDDNEDMPTKEEIEDTAERIFGGFRRASEIELDQVLESLHGLKREIASMSDEEERQRLAAKVALGVVYGMN